MADRPSFLPQRNGETDAEQRLREALDRKATEFMAALNAAISLRTASDEAHKYRQVVRGHLTNAAVMAMHALAVEQAAKTKA